MPPIYDEYDDEHVDLPSCDTMLHRISCENSRGHIMFDNPLNLSYAMGEISHNCLHHMHTIHDNALDITSDAFHNLSLHYAIHTNKPLMMEHVSISCISFI